MASGVGIFFGILILLLVIGGVAWVAYTRIRAKRLGLPPPPLNPFARGSRSSLGGDSYPAPAPSGIVGWVNDKISALKNGRGGRNNARYAAGAYEEPGAARAARNRGTLDPDEAWDARVGNEADYGYGYEEEQELGLRDPHAGTTPYGGGGYAGSGMYAAPPHSAGLSAGSERGRSRTRELDERYDEEMGHSRGAENPFGDNAERSNLRGVSPRPADSAARGGATGDSPSESRRSMFREEV
ncbi:hypothetical protein BFW01_g2486 [Lasiodiplodia theobromae]|uniref:Acid phosphatase-like protein n=2 Tax=Lasiodiplodia TaxID=66739 RepID=A0A5N5DQI3_9PEZI|nr:Acid phosphatase-like protein [Lasiodiplodia theobromae]KAB2580053.1 hypothetical protein DBV05_g1352 [Lasiodiplodia theobromae]KAF4544972.1 Acid phosphatase-like protein [Lasiodiplodia theobromae]KAF9631624.1 hypothetical protein BFW01_g2486 [Lasiodiplodia theobromae]KAK0662602.1 hypothetical protein DIS24_g1595 [Lasiodiplodia hormozganensis]